MTAYAVVRLYLDDTETFAKYREQAGAALAKYKAAPLAVSKEAQTIEGEEKAPDVNVILTFPDRDHALGWINDADLQDIHNMRRGSGKSTITLF